ncbi:MAG: histidine kinase [Blautia sp.]|nr:histidine kinase [Blautia sp.]
MNEWIDLLNFSIAAAGLVVTVLGVILSFRIHYFDPKERTFFISFFLVMFAYVSSDLITNLSLLLVGPEGAFQSRLFLFLESLLSSLLIPMFTLFFVHTLGEDWRKSNLLRIILALWSIYVVMLISNLAAGNFYRITGANTYERGASYPWLLVPPALQILILLAAIVRSRHKLSKGQRQAFYSYLLGPLIAMLIQMRFYGLLLIVFGTTLSGLFMYIQLLWDLVENIIAKTKENEQQRTDILLLQMRPHFIYNTMSSIYYLCAIDAKKAQQVIEDFTTYLRKNFSALSRKELIPFEEELEHTRAYLAVEKARYEKLLFVEYDTPYTAFRLPPLTLQPIVENAVKHGVDPELSPLYITIRTRRSDTESILIVENTGPDYRPASDDEIHTGLANVTERLHLMCSASLEITPRKEGGTVVTIRIPLTTST